MEKRRKRLFKKPLNGKKNLKTYIRRKKDEPMNKMD